MRNKKILIFIFLISICFFISGCSERPGYTNGDFVQEDLLNKKGTDPPKEVFKGVIKAGWVYYSNYDDNQKIYKIRTDGTGKIKLNNHKCCSVIDVVNGWIYYNDCSTGYGSIFKMNTDGKNNAEVIGGSKDKKNSANGFKIIDDWIYYINSYDMDTINRV